MITSDSQSGHGKVDFGLTHTAESPIVWPKKGAFYHLTFGH